MLDLNCNAMPGKKQEQKPSVWLARLEGLGVESPGPIPDLGRTLQLSPLGLGNAK